MSEIPPKELGFKKSPKIISYLRQFSATEKAIFAIFVLAAIVSTIIMAEKINSHFMTQVPGTGGELHEGIIGLPRNINPILAVTDVDRDISSLVYSGLMKWEDDDLVTDLAKSYKISDDGLTYTFIMRGDVFFQDGTALTTDDVAFTIQKVQDSALKSPRKSDWSNVNVEVVSKTEIHFVLKQAYSPFLTNTTLGVLPKHIWDSISNDQFIFNHYNIEPIGSGPYKVVSITNDRAGIPTNYALSTWNKYYDKVPYISNINLSFFSDETEALTALNSGNIDSLGTVTASEAAKLASDKAQPYTVISSPLPRIFGVFFNQNQTAVLGDKVVRQALNMSVDRTAIVKDVLSGYGTPIDKPLLPDTETKDDAKVQTFDIPAAQALLEKNGWKKDATTGIYSKKDKKGTVQTITFDLYTADTADLKQVAEMIKESWKLMGAEVNVRVFNASDLYQNIIRARKYDALLFGELIGKDRDLYAFWHSSQIKAPGLNVSMYTNSKVDKILEDIRTVSDQSSRESKYSQFEELLSADVPAIFLYSPDFIYVIPKALQGIDLHDITLPSDRWNTIDKWYLVTENVWEFFAGK